MASGSFQVPTSNKYIVGTLTWWETGIDAGWNGSYVNYELRFSRTNSGYSSSGTGDFYITINGEQRAHTGVKFTYTEWSNTLVANGSVWVYRNSDGNKQVLIEVDGNTTNHDVYYANASPWLDSIPRASNVTSGISFTAGVDDLVVNISRYSSSYTHLVYLHVKRPSDGEWVWVGQRLNVGTTCTFEKSNITEVTNMYNAIQQYEERDCKLLVVTYNGQTEIGRKEAFGKIRAQATGVAALNNFNIGTLSVPVSIQNYHSSFQYEASFSFNGWSKSFGTVGQNFNMLFSQAEVDEMHKRCTDANSKQGVVTIRTKYNGVLVEDGNPVSHDKIITCFVVNSNPLFTEIEYKDTNGVITPVTGNDQWIIQGKSTVQAKVSNLNKAVAQNFATITKYVATLNGSSLTVNAPFATDITFDFGVVDSDLNINLQITAYDSRGNTTIVNKQVNMVPWTPPAIKTEALRDNGFGTNVVLTLTGEIKPLTVNGVNKNSLVPTGVYYKWRQLPSGNWSANIQFLNQKLTMPVYTTNPVSLTMATTSSFEIVVTVTDKVGNNSTTLNVPIGVPMVMIDEILKNIGIGKFPNSTDRVDVDGSINASGTVKQAGESVVDLSSPSGAVTMFAGSSAPSGWLFCQGQEVSRTTYSKLFAAIGTSYGAGNGSTTFNLPDMRSRVPVGVNAGDTDFNALNKTGGAKTHTLVIGEMPSHDHALIWQDNYAGAGSGAWFAPNTAPREGYATGTARTLWKTSQGAQSAGGGQPHNNMQPYITMNYIIKI